MAGGIRWSLIVPARNGEDTLPECLASLARLKRPADGLEFVLVDNGSTDGTTRLMHEFAEKTAAIVLSEPRRGKSYALNTAIENASGDMLVFLDDDVIVDTSLVEAYASARRDFPDAGVLAGQVRPSWRTSPPTWLLTLTEEGLSCGCTPAHLTADWISSMNVKGGNMCFSRAAIGNSRFALTRVNFGADTRKVGGLDTEFAQRVGRASRIRYVPDAKVQHIIAPYEMSWKSSFSRYLRIGRNNAAQGLAGPGLLRLATKATVYGCFALAAFMLGARTIAARNGLKAAMQLGALDHIVG